MSRYLTLEGPPGLGARPGLGAHPGLEAPPLRYGTTPEYQYSIQKADSLFQDTDFYTFIGSHFVLAHPEGGCIRLRPHPWQADKYAASYSPTEGHFCWDAAYPYTSRKKLWELEPELQPGAPGLFARLPRKKMDLFEALYTPGFNYAEFMKETTKPPDINLQMEMISQGYDPRRREDLEGFFSRFKRAFTPPRAVRRFARRIVTPPRRFKRFMERRLYRPIRKTTLKKSGIWAGRMMAWGMAPIIGPWMPAGMRQKVFNLSDRQNRQAETAAKVARGVIIAAGVVATGGAAAGGASGGTAGTGAAGVGTAGVGTGTGAGVSAETAAKVGALEAGKGGIIARAGTFILDIAKTAAGAIIVKRLTQSQVPGYEDIPEDGMYYGYGEDPTEPMIGDQAAYPGGMPSALLPWADDEDPVEELLSDDPLKDAIKKVETKRLPIPPTLMLLGASAGLGLLALAWRRG